MPRPTTLAGRLAVLGFADTALAGRLLADQLGLDVTGADAELVEAIAAAADPDLALTGLTRLAESLDRANGKAGQPAGAGRPEGSEAGPEGSEAGPEGSEAGPDGSEAGPDGSKAGPGGEAGPDGSKAGPGGEAGPDGGRAGLVAALRGDPGLRRRLISVLGVSPGLADQLSRHPADWLLLRGPAADRLPRDGELREAFLAAAGLAAAGLAAAGLAAAGLAVSRTGAGGGDTGRGAGAGAAAAGERVRAEYRRRLLVLAARDLTGRSGLDEVMAELADLAAAVLEAALVIAEAELPAGPAPCRLAVIAMGKCGGRELNYRSDVDVIFVAEPDDGAEDDAAALRTAANIAAGLIRFCSAASPEGAIFPVDPNLRPEGRSGPLVRTLASHLAYYKRWAKTWEFQALLKARPVAGDAALGQAYLDALVPLVWEAAERKDFVADVQAMRRRVVAAIPADEAGRELKLGPGGLRDIEFAVQLLQLVHGRADRSLRAAATLDALAALAAGGYVGRADEADLAAAYRFLRTVEHLVQLRQLRRTHLLPTDPAVLRQLGRAMRDLRRSTGGSTGSLTGDPAEELLALRRSHAAHARQLHEKLFYRPLLDAVARLPGEVVRLTPQAARQRLEALGYVDPAGALRHIQHLTSGISRKAAIQRALLPALLGWFADAPRPDAGLLAFRQVSEALGDSPWFLRLLRDDPSVARRLARVLASGTYATGLLRRAPDAVAMLGDDALLAPRDPAALHAEAMAIVRHHPDAGRTAEALLALRRRELLRTAAAGLLGSLRDPAAPDGARDAGELAAVAGAISAITAVTIGGALDAAIRDVERASGGRLPARVAVVAMGRFGGQEMGYASDADVLFVFDPVPGAEEEAATRAAHAVAEELRSMLGRPGPDPSLPVDADLRPEGRQGPLVRSLGAYQAYYERWSAPWETQALLRALPVAGDAGLGAAFTAMADRVRYPEGGLPAASVRDIRRIKARMEAERMPRAVDPALHVKLGPGGLTDAEWVAQLLQLLHADHLPELRTTRTIPALAAAGQAGLIDTEAVAALSGAWVFAARIRNAVLLVRGRGSDVVPTGQPELGAVARLLGYPAEAAQDLVEDWRRSARRARAAMERAFYG